MFRKTGRGNLFETEAEGLRRLAVAARDVSFIKIPRVFGAKNHEFIEMECLNLLSSSADRLDNIRLLARAMQTIHSAPAMNEDTGALSPFGFPLPGQCGALRHPNNCEGKRCDWVEFFIENRLGYQLHVLEYNTPSRNRTVQQVIDLTKRVVSGIGELFEGKGVHRENIVPSLLHGDLWEGNWGVISGDDGRKKIALFDPAPFYGHFEYDFGIGSMFGGPVGKDFYQEYFASSQSAAPGFEERVLVYSLFHHLNHMNIFGADAYGRGALRTLESIVDRVKGM